LKLDLVMWTKNGAETLGSVLNRINHVVPGKVVNQRLLVDDCSVDDTVRIAESFGWHVFSNEGKGIGDGANTALKHVETEYFCSFEQDILLSPFWWNRISRLILGKDDVAAACGLRFLPKNNLFFNVVPYRLTRRHVDYLGGFGKTLDNTIWNTDVLRGLGGFPKLKYGSIDTYLWNLIDAKGYRWLVDYDVQSLHLRPSLFGELKHWYFYGLSLPESNKRLSIFSSAYQNQGRLYYFLKFMKSPATSFKMSLKMHDVRLLVAYPAVSFYSLMGYLKGKSLGDS